jgi:hypothetical protein
MNKALLDFPQFLISHLGSQEADARHHGGGVLQEVDFPGAIPLKQECGLLFIQE